MELAYVRLIVLIYIQQLVTISCFNTLEMFSKNKNSPDAINGSINFRLHHIKSKDEKTWFNSPENPLQYCGRPAKCEKLEINTCFNAKIPYTHISLDLTDSTNQQQAREKLIQYRALIHIPKCWAVIQPFLCAVYFPKCESNSNVEFVYVPSFEMCRITMEPCRLLYNTSFFPNFLKCNQTLYSSFCKNDVRDMKFNVTGECLPPLVKTDSTTHFYEGIEGCGLQCNDPLYTEDEHQQIHNLIGWGATICLLCNVFTICTFLVDWQSANKYPALVIFYINCWFLVSCLGFMAQFFPGGRIDIVCRKDGTLRQSEPSATENLSCVIVFVMVYYSLIAAMVWFVIFTYVWHMSFQAIGKIQERIDKKGAYFHLIACSLPLVLTITTMALSEIDGSSIVGICFVGYMNHAIRAGLLLGPICGVIITGGYFLTRGFLTLISLKLSSKGIISDRASRKIRETIVRMGLCTLLMGVLIIGTFVCHFNEFRNTEEWSKSLTAYITCLIRNQYDGSNSTEICRLASRPSVALLQLHLLCWFCTGVIMSSWVWTRSSVEAWKRYIRKKFDCEIDEPVKLQKHKVIAQAFAKRKEFHDAGRLSISFHNTHTDPLGFNFELNSVASHDFSSTWANNLPRFVNRRCALTCGPTTGSVSSSHCGGHRRNSLDSEISFSVRHVSVESRRNSIDSQVSVKIAEMKTKVASRSRSKNKRNRRRDFSNKRYNKGMSFLRRESSTSLETQIGAQILKALSSETSTKPSLKRRSANAGLDPDQINSLFSNGKIILPFIHNQGLTTSDDEESHSVASLRIKDSRLNVILRQKASLSSNESLSKGRINIEEYHSSDDNKVALKNVKETSGYTSNDDNHKINTSMKKEKDGRSSKNSTKHSRTRKSVNARRSKRSCRERTSRFHKSSDLKNETTELINNKDKNEDHKKSPVNPSGSMSSFNSYCSELSPLAIQSSYSGISVGKTNSRNSKISCDVGIQANAHEIATQTMSSYEKDSQNKSKNVQKSRENADMLNKPTLLRRGDGTQEESYLKSVSNRRNSYACEQECEAMQLLLPSVKTTILPKKRQDSITNSGQSESDKLKLLLLPSN